MEVQSMSIEYANVTYRTVRYLPVPDTNIYVRTYKYEDNIFSHLRRIDTYDTYVDCESVIHRFPFNSFIRFFDWSTKSSSYGTVWYRNRYCTVLYCTSWYHTICWIFVPILTFYVLWDYGFLLFTLGTFIIISWHIDPMCR